MGVKVGCWVGCMGQLALLVLVARVCPPPQVRLTPTPSAAGQWRALRLLSPSSLRLCSGDGDGVLGAALLVGGEGGQN